MNEGINQNSINRALLAACDTFRRTISTDTYKDFIFYGTGIPPAFLLLKKIKNNDKECFEEQQKANTVLSRADRKLHALQQKFDALRQKKEAQLQQLLIDKRRVPLN